MRRISLLVSRVAIGIVFAVSAVAQQPTAEITGLITDESGATVPAASLDVANTDTGIHWRATSNESGNYVFSILPPGHYSITVAKQGFDKTTRSGIELTVGQVARLDFKLRVGSTTETVEVRGAAPLLESDTA